MTILLHFYVLSSTLFSTQYFGTLILQGRSLDTFYCIVYEDFGVRSRYLR